MENLQARKEELQGFIDSRKKQLDEGVSLAAKGVIESEIASFEAEIAAIEEHEQNEAAAQVRIQAQEEKIESEPIPFAVSGIDLTELDPDLARIIEIVTKADRRIQAEGHNTEIQKLIDSNREDARAWADRELQLKRQNDTLQHKVNDMEEIIGAGKSANAELIRENGDLRDHVAKLNLEIAESDSKRDAAMAELDGVKLALQVAQEEIQQMRAAGHYGESNAQKVIDITPEETSEIQSLVSNLAKKLVSVNSIGGNWKEAVYDDGSKEVVHANYVDQLEAVAPPIVLGVSTFQPNQASDTHIQLDSGTAEQDAADHQEVEPPTTFPVSGGNQVDTGISSEDGNTSEAQTVTRQEFEELKSAVDTLYVRQRAMEESLVA